LSPARGCKIKATYRYTKSARRSHPRRAHARKIAPRIGTDSLPPMTNSQLQPPAEQVPLSRLIIWGAIAVVLVLGIWLYVRYGRSIAPLINS
jgi:hypothetical protein